MFGSEVLAGGVTIWLSGSPRGCSVAGPSSLPDQHPCFFRLKDFWFWVQAGVSKELTRGS